MLTFSPKKKKSPIKSMLGFSVMVAAISSVLFMNSRPIDVEVVEKRLGLLTAELAAQAKIAGKPISFTYGTLELLGVGYEKYVQVNDPVLVIGDASDPAKHFSVATGKLTVNFDPINDKRFIFKLSQPLVLNRFGKKSVIKHQKPIKFGFFQKDFNNPLSDRLLTLRLPLEIDFETPLRRDPAAKFTTNLMFENMPELNYDITGAGATSEARFELRNISANVGDNEKSNIGALAGSISETRSADGRYSGTLTFTVSDYIHQRGDAQARTCSLTSNVTYGSATSVINVIGIPNEAIDVKLNRLVLSCDDFSIKAEGDLSLLADESPPAGAVKLSIENVKRFMASDLWPLALRNQLPAAMPKITGQPADAREDVAFDIKREKGGKLMLGAVSLEESGITMPVYPEDSQDDEPEPAPAAGAEAAAGPAAAAAAADKKQPAARPVTQESIPERSPEQREIELQDESPALNDKSE